VATRPKTLGTLEDTVPPDSGSRDVGAQQVVRAGRIKERLRLYLPALLLFVGLVGVWQLVATFTGIKDYVLPKPTEIATTIWSDRSSLIPAAGVTFSEVIIGFGLAVSVGFMLAVLFVHSRIAQRAIYPMVIATQTIPILAIAPVLVIWFGFGLLPKILVVALFGFFPVAINTVAGMNSVDRDTFRLMQSLGASRWEVFRRVRLPASLPFFFVGVKLAAVVAVIGAVAGEWVGSTNGMGPLMIAANSYLRTNLVFAAIVYLSVMAVGMFLIVTLIERLVIGWYFISKEAEAGSG
jgi:putative hydroxymethylpyrimidine transport system permease protein